MRYPHRRTVREHLTQPRGDLLGRPVDAQLRFHFLTQPGRRAQLLWATGTVQGVAVGADRPVLGRATLRATSLDTVDVDRLIRAAMTNVSFAWIPARSPPAERATTATRSGSALKGDTAGRAEQRRHRRIGPADVRRNLIRVISLGVEPPDAVAGHRWGASRMPYTPAGRRLLNLPSRAGLCDDRLRPPDRRSRDPVITEREFRRARTTNARRGKSCSPPTCRRRGALHVGLCG